MVRADLIQLAKEDFEPTYELGVHLDYPDLLKFFTYEPQPEGINDDTVREIILEKLESKFHKKYNEERKAELQRKLEHLKFPKYHNPFSKEHWKALEFEGVFSVLSDFTSAFFVGEKIYHSNLKEGIIIALSLQVVNEGVRRMSRSQTKRSLKRFEKELRRYDLIKRTLRESKIEIIRPSRAQEVCQKMQRTKEILGPYGSINLDRVNEDLTSAYRKAGAIIE